MNTTNNNKGHRLVFGKRLTTINTFTILLQELRCDFRIDLLRLALRSRSAGGLGRGSSGPRRRSTIGLGRGSSGREEGVRAGLEVVAGTGVSTLVLPPLTEDVLALRTGSS
jgi:hypothetical protein